MNDETRDKIKELLLKEYNDLVKKNESRVSGTSVPVFRPGKITLDAFFERVIEICLEEELSDG